MILTAILLSFIPALTVLGVQYWLRDPEHIEKYEKEFLRTHKDVVDIYNHLVPSGFNTEDTQFLLHVCEEAQKLGKQRDEQQPEVQHHHIDFKKVSHPPFFVEVIRCCSKFAVIKAPQKQTAYLLRIGKRNPKIPTDIFFFFSKFLYYKRNLSPEEIQERIEMYNSHQQLVSNKEEAGRVKRSSTSDSGSEFSQEYNFSWLFENEGKLDVDGSALLTGGKSSTEEVEESNKKSEVVTTSSEKSELPGEKFVDKPEQPEPLQSDGDIETTKQKDKEIHRESFEKSVQVSNPPSADVETFVEENDQPLPLSEPQKRSDKIVENIFGVDSTKSEALIQNPSSADLTIDQKVEEISGVASSEVTHAIGDGIPPSKFFEFEVTAKSEPQPHSPSLVTEKEFGQKSPKDDKPINKVDQLKTDDQSKTFITNSIESYQHDLLESTQTLFPLERQQTEEIRRLEWNTNVTREREKWNARAKARVRKNHFSNHPTFINNYSSTAVVF